MKDPKGHGSNIHGGLPMQKQLYHRGAFRPAGSLAGKHQANAQKADDTAQRVLNGLHSGKINDLPKLERRHYESIAASLAAEGAGKDPITHAQDTAKYASLLATTNPRFDKGRFIAAATPKGSVGGTPGKNFKSGK